MTGIDWDMHYQSDRAPWETGQPSSELGRVLAEEKIGPCRVIELGCGSGINAVWLAEQGFDVTGVDFNRLAVEKAGRRASAAGVSVRFVLGDVLDLRERYDPFPFFFDRGCYHVVRSQDVAAYVETLRRVTAPGSVGLVLTGNAKERHEPGPPVVSEAEIRAELGAAFEIVRLREFRFDSGGAIEPGPLGWSCLVRRR
jgi:SAM-dependent methyltransferase